MTSSGSDGNDGEEAVSSQSPKQELLTKAETLISLSSSSSDSRLRAASLLNLPFDLVLEILFRLPVKTLAQLRCLCKSWNSLISDPKFARKHHRYSRTVETRHHLILLLRDYDPGLKDGDDEEGEFYFLGENEEGEFHICDSRIPSVFDSTSIIPEMEFRYPLTAPQLHDVIIGTCDGLICFTNSDDHRSYLVWNPCINKFKISPPLEYQSDDYLTISGFGYDRVTDAYKVFVVCVYIEDLRNRSKWVAKTQVNVYTLGTNSWRKTQVNVYTLGTNSWRRIQDFPFGKPDPYLGSGKFVSGAINWLAETGLRSSVIVFLDLGNESYREIVQPNYGEVGAVPILTLGVLRDCLCVLSHFDNFWDIWVMKDYVKEVSWTKLFTIPAGVLGYRWAFRGYAQYISLNDQLLLNLCNEVVVYNSKDGTLKTPRIQQIDSFPSDVYMESLVPP